MADLKEEGSQGKASLVTGVGGGGGAGVQGEKDGQPWAWP